MSDSNPNVEIILELKSAVLNIDWEISDETLAELAAEVTKLQGKWVEKKVLLVYLQILGALCQYIGVSREKSHPGTFVLLKDTFDGLEDVVKDPDMVQAEQNKNVMTYAQRYNQLKKEIAEGDFTPGPPEDEGDEKSTMGDDEDHATDTVFDSMLNAMVQTPENEDSENLDSEVDADFSVGSEVEPESTPPPPPPARPSVQAAFNKADGTEVEPDRNEDDEFAEADELLDDFFDDDDDIPAPEAAPSTRPESEEIGGFDLDELQEEDEDEILDLALEEEEALNDDGYVEADLTGSAVEEDDASAVVEDEAGELVIDIDGEQSSESEDSDETFQEMEDALDDFFGDEEGDEDLLDPVGEEADDDVVIDEALDDFFGEDGDDEGVPEVGGGPAQDEDSLSLETKDEQFDLDDEDDAEEIVVDVEEVVCAEEFDEPAITPENTADEFVVEDGLSTQEADAVELREEDESVGAEDDETSLSAEGDAEEIVAGQVPTEKVEEPVASVADLKRLLLSVDWEVDDQLLHRLEEEINLLTEVVRDNAAARIHLSLLGTVIRYIGREQADVISDSMTCLKLIVDSLENLMQDQTGDSSRFSDEAVRSFVDWHELVVLDFEHRLAECGHAPEQVVESVVPPDDNADIGEEGVDSLLPEDIKSWKEDILKEVKDLIVKEIAELKFNVN